MQSAGMRYRLQGRDAKTGTKETRKRVLRKFPGHPIIETEQGFYVSLALFYSPEPVSAPEIVGFSGRFVLLQSTKSAEIPIAASDLR